MSFDFTPRNKKAGDYHLGAFSWPWMLDSGLGLVLGIGAGFTAGDFIWIERKDKRCPRHNDGARITVKESKELAKVARWIARVERAKRTHFATLPEEERTRIETDKHGIYKKPWAEEAIARFDKFADWSEKSGGFRID